MLLLIGLGNSSHIHEKNNNSRFKSKITTITAAAAVVVVEQATEPMVLASCPGCEIPGRSGFASHCSHKSKALRGLVATR